MTAVSTGLGMSVTEGAATNYLIGDFWIGFLTGLSKVWFNSCSDLLISLNLFISLAGEGIGFSSSSKDSLGVGTASECS